MSNENKMLDDLVDEIGMIDDDIIESSSKAMFIKKKNIWKKYASIAACFLLVSVFAVVFFKNDFSWFDNDENCYNEESYSYLNNFYSDNNSPSGSNIWDTDNYGSNDGNKTENSDNLTVSDVKDELLNSEDDVSIDRNPVYGSDETLPESGSSNDSTSVYPPSSPTRPHIVPSLTEKVVIDNFNKLAYYSGWSVLRKTELDLLSAYFSYRQLTPLSNINISPDIYSGEDISVADIELFQDVYSTSPDIIDEYETLIPIDPGFSGEIYAYAIYEIKIKSVEYFRMSLESKCYLADQIGAGDNIEVMILDLVISDSGNETMIVFKNGDNFFSCLCESMYEFEDHKAYKFTPAKYISYFSIVKMPELSKHEFSVDLKYHYGKCVSVAFLADYEIESIVDMETYHYEKCDDGEVYTAFGLTEELYKIYLEEVAAGVTKPIIPDIPQKPEQNYESVLVGTFEAENNFVTNLFDEKEGYISFSKTSKEAAAVLESFDNSNLKEILEIYPDEIPLTLAWVKGIARLSSHNICIKNEKIILEVDYYMFNENANVYTLFLFEGDIEASLCRVDYSISVVATFEALKSDSDEQMIINLHDNERYKLYVNDVLVYTGGYKLSNGMICLTTENDTHYIQLNGDGSFVYEGRTFKLLP